MTKKKKEKCSWCNGKGIISSLTFNEYTEETYLRECHLCDGTGKVEMENESL